MIARLPEGIPVGLCAFGMTWHCGLIPDDKTNPTPWSARQLFEHGRSLGLTGLEIPFSMLPESGTEVSRDLLRGIREGGGELVLAAGVLSETNWDSALPVAAAAGVRTLRCTLSRLLCGDRRSVPAGWRAYLEEQRSRLADLVPRLDRYGLRLAVENHQDADSDDLLFLCRDFPEEVIGVTLDTGNPLAVMEDPVDFARRVAPRLFHMHLKDYTVYSSPRGFRLVRAALGTGVIDFAALCALARDLPQRISLSLELAALHAREILITEPDWWEHMGSRDTGRLCSAWKTLLPNIRACAEDFRTPIERAGCPGESLAEYERRQVRESAGYLRRLWAESAATGG